MTDGQQSLFYEDIYDAIERDIAACGKGKKEVASLLYPGRKIETAMSLLSRALSPENTDVHISLEHLLFIMALTGGQNVMNHLCDINRMDRTKKRDIRSIEVSIKEGLASVEKQMKALFREAQRLEEFRSEGTK